MADSFDNESEPAATKFKALRSELRSWSSSIHEFAVAEAERKFMFSNPPDLGCIVCKKDIDTTPVYQCQTGHLACNHCSQSGRSCPECEKAISRIKNVAVGNIIKSLVVSCKYAKLGCKAMTGFTEERSEHEDICEFAPMKCPMLECNRSGVKNLLHEHLAAKHRISLVVNISTGYKYDDWHNAVKFDLESSTTLVLLRHAPSKEFHLLHQESTVLGERLQITSLAKPPAKFCKRKYELHVKVNKEQTYYHQSMSTSNPEEHGGLLIPKLPGGVPAEKKRCTILMRKS